MFSALKRLVGNQNDNKTGPDDVFSQNNCPRRNSVQPMGHHLQRKFAKGVQYNSKFIYFIDMFPFPSAPIFSCVING